jgi:hypothetical protein
VTAFCGDEHDHLINVFYHLPISYGQVVGPKEILGAFFGMKKSTPDCNNRIE